MPVDSYWVSVLRGKLTAGVVVGLSTAIDSCGAQSFGPPDFVEVPHMLVVSSKSHEFVMNVRTGSIPTGTVKVQAIKIVLSG